MADLTEQLPGEAGGISALGSAAAPYIYFDGVGAFGTNDGMLHATLEAFRYHARHGAPVLTDRVQTAHLRMTATAARQLISALSQALQMAAPPVAGEEVN